MDTKVSETRFLFLVLWMQKIIECEGGEVIMFTDKDVKKALIKSDIPSKHWCKRCNSLVLRIAEMQERWMGKMEPVSDCLHEFVN